MRGQKKRTAAQIADTAQNMALPDDPSLPEWVPYLMNEMNARILRLEHKVQHLENMID